MATDLYVGDYGRPVKPTVAFGGSAIDVSGVSLKQVHFLRPDSLQVVKTADFDSDGTDGILTYTIEDGLIDRDGSWKYRAYIEGHGTYGAAHTEWQTFTVGE